MIRLLLHLWLGLVLLAWSERTVAQTAVSHNHRNCAVGLEDGYIIKNRMLQNRRDKAALLDLFEQSRGNDSTVWVPILFHIVTKADGTGGETIDDVLDNLCTLNDDYRNINVEFYLAGPVRYVPQDFLYNNGFDPLASFYMAMYKETGVVNVFIGNRAVSTSGFTAGGFYSPSLDAIYAIRSAINGNGTTLTHELGHFFSLNHTFFGWEETNYDSDVMPNTTGRTPTFLPSGAEVEKIARSGGTENCQLAADGFCDTDANYLFGYFGGQYNDNTGCNFIGTAHDPYGILFYPSVIGATSPRFVLEEGSNALSSMRLQNASNKNLTLYGKTLVIVETKFTNAGNTTTMWLDTIGDTDSTDFYVGGPGSDDILQGNAADVADGFINTGDYTLDVNVSSGTSDLSFIATAASFAVQGADHTTTMDSLRVTNNSAINTIAAGTVITVQEVFKNGSTTINSETWTRALPNALAPGASYTFNFIAETKSTAGGVSFEVATYAPFQAIVDPTSTNVMSYYPDLCATQFTPEQGEAMKADIASRGFATLYSEPNDITLTDPVVPINPMSGAVSPSPSVHFQWNPVNGATMYFVRIFEKDIFNNPLQGGFYTERITSDTDFWLTLPLAGGSPVDFGWSITPMNTTYFCSDSLTTGTLAFEVNDWSVGTQQVQAASLTSKIYPNPSKQSQEVVLEIEANKNGQATIGILNSVGQTVMTAPSMPINAGINIQKLNTSALAAGLYIITIKTEDDFISHKLLIQQ